MASITRRGSYQFQAVVRRKGWPSQTKTFESRAQAQAWARSVESQIDDGKFRDRRPLVGLTLQDALQRYLVSVSVNKRSHANERQRISQLQRHSIALRQLDELRASDYAAYRDARLRQVSANTVRLEIALLSHLYTIAIKEWCLPLRHELKDIRKPSAGLGRSRRLMGNEEGLLLAGIGALKNPGQRAALDTCVRLAIHTGMRAGEILSLKWDDIDLVAGRIRLTTSKNGTSRTVPLTEAAVELLESLPTRSGKPIAVFRNTVALDSAFRAACTKADLRDLRFHDLRHEAASRFAPHMTVQVLAKVMGWRTLQMAMRYFNPSDSELVQHVRSAARAANAAALQRNS